MRARLTPRRLRRAKRRADRARCSSTDRGGLDGAHVVAARGERARRRRGSIGARAALWRRAYRRRPRTASPRASLPEIERGQRRRVDARDGWARLGAHRLHARRGRRRGQQPRADIRIEPRVGGEESGMLGMCGVARGPRRRQTRPMERVLGRCRARPTDRVRGSAALAVLHGRRPSSGWGRSLPWTPRFRRCETFGQRDRAAAALRGVRRRGEGVPNAQWFRAVAPPGLEPGRPRGPRILNPPRLPFRHGAKCLTLF